MVSSPLARRILVVDDDHIAARALAAALGQFDAVCEHAANGQIALARLGAGAFDAVVLDYDMPDMTGEMVAVRLRKMATDHCRVVMVTGHDIGPFEHLVRDGVIDALMTKPFRMDELAAALRLTEP